MRKVWRQILSSFFNMPVRVESFRGAWLRAARDGCLAPVATAAPTAALGRSAFLGRRVWSRQHKFRLVFGPLSLPEYERLLPGGLSFHRLVPIVRNYVGDALVWDVTLILRAAEVPPIRLGRQGRLGWTTWLMPRRRTTPTPPICTWTPALTAMQSHEARHHIQRGRPSMTEISRAALFGKLNPIAYRAIEGATVFCKLRGNPYVELVHWLHQILQAPDSDLSRIVRHFQHRSVPAFRGSDRRA